MHRKMLMFTFDWKAAFSFLSCLIKKIFFFWTILLLYFYKQKTEYGHFYFRSEKSHTYLIPLDLDFSVLGKAQGLGQIDKTA